MMQRMERRNNTKEEFISISIIMPSIDEEKIQLEITYAIN